MMYLNPFRGAPTEPGIPGTVMCTEQGCVRNPICRQGSGRAKAQHFGVDRHQPLARARPPDIERMTRRKVAGFGRLRERPAPAARAA